MPTQDFFRDKACVVTGAASGIGFALSEALLQAGAVVTMADRNEAALAAAVEKLRPFADRVGAAGVDVAKREAVDALLQDAAARHGRLDILFNNAGIGWGGPIREATQETWRRILDVNLWGVIHGVQAALPIMDRQGGGHIVNTASILGLVPGVYEAIYSAAKHAVVGLSESLRFELEADDIHVSVVCPGAVATNIFPEGTTPADAITPAEAAATILEGVARRKGIILVPVWLREFWLEYCRTPEAEESFFRDRARQRRQLCQAAKTRP